MCGHYGVLCRCRFACFCCASSSEGPAPVRLSPGLYYSFTPSVAGDSLTRSFAGEADDEGPSLTPTRHHHHRPILSASFPQSGADHDGSRRLSRTRSSTSLRRPELSSSERYSRGGTSSPSSPDQACAAGNFGGGPNCVDAVTTS